MPTFPTHAVVPPQTMYSPAFWKFTPFVELKLYVSVPHGLPVQQPVAVLDDSVLNAWRVPFGTQPFVHAAFEQYGVWPLHVTPQPPQLFLSVRTLVHALPQYSWPCPQQWPPLHHSSVAHAVLQAPQ